MAPTQPLHTLLEQTGWIHALARRLVTDPHLAADLAQDTTVDALEQQPDGVRPLRGWLATVMRNNLSKLRRGERNRTAREERVRRDELAPAALEVVEKAETHRNVVLAVLALDEPYRSTLLMRFFEQLSYDEIARRTGVTRASVNSRVTRGLEQLRQRLENTYGGDRRALSLALTPLAKLPTGVATTTTILGLKTMHIAIGTAAATLLAATVSVGVFSGGREPREPSSRASVSSSGPAPEKLALVTPLEFAPGEPARAALPPQRAQQQKEKKKIESDESVWRTELFQAQVVPATVESIAVNTGAGDVEVLASTTGRLEVQAKVRAKLGTVKDVELTQVFEDHVTIREEDGTLIVEDAHKNSRGWSVSFVVSIPGNYPLRANSGSGDVTVKSAKGQVHANTGSGDVRVQLVQERMKELQANTGSGDVEVEVFSVEKDLSANTGSGDVRLLVADPSSPGRVGMNSGSGDLLLVVPGGIVGSFDLATHGSEISMPPALGIQIKKDISGQQSARGVIGSNGGEYKLRSGSGDLTVQIGNVLPPKQR